MLTRDSDARSERCHLGRARRVPRAVPASADQALVLVFVVQIPAWVYLGGWFVYQLVEAHYALVRPSEEGAASRSSRTSAGSCSVGSSHGRCSTRDGSSLSPRRDRQRPCRSERCHARSRPLRRCNRGSAPLGAALGCFRTPPRQLTAGLLAFAAGALVVAVAFELFEPAHRQAGLGRASAALLVGAATFVAVDLLIQRHTGAEAAGLALVAAVTLDGVPENLALGVGLAEGSSYALLASIVASNFPEAFGGAAKLRQGGLLRPRPLRLGADGGAARRSAGRGGSPRTSYRSSRPACWPYS